MMAKRNFRSDDTTNDPLNEQIMYPASSAYNRNIKDYLQAYHKKSTLSHHILVSWIVAHKPYQLLELTHPFQTF